MWRVVRPSTDPEKTTTEGDDHDPAATILKVSLPPVRPRARKEILVPGNAGSQPRRVDEALILALARARSWMRALRRGEYADTAEIARCFGLSDPHIRRILRLPISRPTSWRPLSKAVSRVC